MIVWETPLLKDIQYQENRITAKGASKETIEDAQIQMALLTEKHIKQTKPVAKSANVNFIGRNTYTRQGELVAFTLEPLVKYRDVV